VQGIIASIRASGRKKVLLFAHGGLNNRGSGRRRVTHLVGPIWADGYYPLFLNWNSDLWHSLAEDLVYVRQGRLARYWGPVSAPMALLVAIATGALRVVMVWAQMLSSDVNAMGIRRFSFSGKRNSDAIGVMLLTGTAPGDAESVCVSLGADRVSTVRSVAAFLVYVATLVPKLAVSPILDGLGQRAWRNMLRRTQMVFHRDEDFDVRDIRDDAPRLRARVFGPPGGAAYTLFNALTELMNAQPELELTLVGHSMGTIVLNRALREFPDLRVRKIVYMAAACTIDDFRSSVVPYLVRLPSTEFHNLMLHPGAEVREWQIAIADLPPRGSLLVWIDNFLASPETTLDRTLGTWENAMQAVHVIPTSIRRRVTMKAFGVGGNEWTPETHGAFATATAKFWRPDFWR
jgi:pimeloyl-ACP methyl ester carboxylesterase